MTIDNWLTDVTEQFSRANIPSARLDAELLLCHLLGVDRTWLVAHADELISRAALTSTTGTHPGGIREYGDRLVLGRLKRQPMAYLLGHKEFYGRDFIVNRYVLIPRPETEALIELAKKYELTGRVLDVGTGSGAIGLTLWHELTGITLTLSDQSEQALSVAEKNAKKLKVKPFTSVQSDLLEHWNGEPETFDVIVANLPYVDRKWERSPETEHEPAEALFTGDGGLALIKELIDQASELMPVDGYLLLEADPSQHESIKTYASGTFQQLDQLDYGLLFERIAA